MMTTSLVDNAIDLPWRNRKVRSLGQSPRGKYPDVWRYLNFLIKPARFVQSFRYIPACDKQTDKRTHDDSMYLASIWLRGNKILNVTGGRCPRQQFSVWGEGGNVRTTVAAQCSMMSRVVHRELEFAGGFAQRRSLLVSVAVAASQSTEPNSS